MDWENIRDYSSYERFKSNGDGTKTQIADHKAADTVVMVVREKETYGQAKGGELVRIDRAELRNSTVLSALMSTDEFEAEQRAKAEAAAAKAKPKPNPIVSMVEAGLARLAERAKSSGSRA